MVSVDMTVQEGGDLVGVTDNLTGVPRAGDVHHVLGVVTGR